MKRDLQGEYVTISTVGETARAYVPKNLPPEPAIDWHPELRERFDHALLSLGRLDSMSTLLPDTPLFLYTYIRKEAVLSSMIEGTQSSLSQLLLFELDEEPGVPMDDVEEVSNYVAALFHGLRRLSDGFPISLRLLKEIHQVLLSSGRGNSQEPGEFRRSQNWIGGTRPGNAAFVPPPPEKIIDCMGALEHFLHDRPHQTPVLLKAALAHVQFETIHPFLDGNGRLGRLLITLLLCEHRVLQEPMLYLSLYFKSHRRQYYELLNRVRETGDCGSSVISLKARLLATPQVGGARIAARRFFRYRFSLSRRLNSLYLRSARNRGSSCNAQTEIATYFSRSFLVCTRNRSTKSLIDQYKLCMYNRVWPRRQVPLISRSVKIC